jgi:hypothetical protein
MATDSPDYVQPVTVEAGQVVVEPGSSPLTINPATGSTFDISGNVVVEPGSSPLTINPATGSTFDISGPVTIAGATVTVPSDISKTPTFGSAPLYSGTNLATTGAWRSLPSMDTSKYAGLVLAGYSAASHWQLYLHFYPPGAPSTPIWQPMLRARAGMRLVQWLPVASPLLGGEYQGPAGGQIDYLYLYGSTVPAPACSTNRHYHLLEKFLTSIPAGGSDYWYPYFAVGGAILTARGNAGQPTDILVMGCDYTNTIYVNQLAATVTLGYAQWTLALGPWMYSIYVKNNGSAANSISLTLQLL